ncbi:AI-2E family transporter [Pseudoxanthomonas kaohsiungensis]|uniref:AI-2E family transporter n=1 Tax=Pseudoxanthomonas kaohsiungensis TaxID=283923 RepID=A0ABW3LZE2_9GAMM|nr:AI-2E family transporter [Pseudoxanthomonas kaohsiungensis]
MNERFRALVRATVFAVLLGWVLHVGRDILVPVVFAILVVYVIIGAARLAARLPVVGAKLPVQVHYLLATALILGALLVLGWVALDSVDRLVAQVPHYRAQLVWMVQQGAGLLGIDSEPSWQGIRDWVLGQVSVQALAGSTLAWLGAMLAGFTVVGLYVVFLMLERRHFDAKLGRLSDDPGRVARVRRIIGDINGRIGTYLALKTALSVLLGFASWVILALFGVELAPFWALVIGLLNYVPYIGSVLGVVLPVLFAVLQFGDLRTALLLAGALSVAQFLNGNLLDPYLMGNSLNLSPFVILVSLTVWTALWGVPGAFLAVPVTASIVMVLAEFDGSRPLAVLLSRKGEV